MTTEKQVTETLQVTEATRKRPKKSDKSVIPEQLWSDPLADQPDSLSIFPGFFASACASLLRKTRKIYLIGIKTFYG